MAYGTNDGEITPNPIIQIGLNALESDNFYFVENPEEQYIGLYHIHQDGEIMIGAGELGITHEMIPSEIIFQKVTYAAIQETREAVSDIFYKLWFESNTLTDEQLLSLQTTIRDGIKQSGRTEDEPLVFYKKDRNTLENRKDIEGDIFEQLCQYIFDNSITELEGKFSIIQIELPAEGTPPQSTIQYKIKFIDGTNVYEINVAKKIGNEFTDILNLSQLTKPKTGSKIDPDKAREVLDTNIFELLPNQPNRQNQINNFFNEFDNLIGPTPVFVDLNGDTILESAENYEDDEQSRISYENQIDAYITRLISQSEGDTNNQGKTLEDMRNKLNTYLFDVDNKVQGIIDQRPEYENKSNGFLKIRKPNQAIIIRSQSNNILEFQKQNENGVPSYLSDGFTITMWVRFVDKQSEGTLFNFGNPLEEDGEGFRLDTKVNNFNDKYYRYIRLIVRDDNKLRDNHFGYSGIDRISERSTSAIPPQGHNAFPQIPTDNLNEWYFICATFNPSIKEDDSLTLIDFKNDKQFWLNHRGVGGVIKPVTEFGAKCKVELISRSDLLKARGYKIGDLSIDVTEEENNTLDATESDSVDITSDTNIDVPDNIITFGAGGGEY